MIEISECRHLSLVLIPCFITSYTLHSNFSSPNAHDMASEVDCPKWLTTRKRGERNIQDHQSNFASHHVRNTVSLSFVNWSYQRRSFLTILAVTTRKWGVWERPYHLDHHSQNPDYVDFASRFTSPNNAKIGWVKHRTRCITIPNVLQLENGEWVSQ